MDNVACDFYFDFYLSHLPENSVHLASFLCELLGIREGYLTFDCEHFLTITELDSIILYISCN